MPMEYVRDGVYVYPTVPVKLYCGSIPLSWLKSAKLLAVAYTLI